MRLPKDTTDDSPLNLTAMIDVLFILLIFFLVATQLHSEEKLVSINLAEIFEAQPLATGAKEIIVNITKEGGYNISGTDYDEAQLISILEKAGTENPRNVSVQIRADQEAQFKYPLTVIGVCKRENLEYSCTVLERQS
jgi:biopolymer transport protein ExbD